MHGGDIYRNQVRLDFSVNINPLGMPEGVRQALHRAVERSVCYPDITARALTDALADTFMVAKEQLCLGNGASELFSAIVHAIRPGKVLLQAPSFGGYVESLKAIPDCSVTYVYSKEQDGFALGEAFLQAMTDEVDLVFLASPNNPTGALIPEELLMRILWRAEENEITVVLDECFWELSEHGSPSAITWMREGKEVPGLIVVRAFTKSFAIPGVRLGYCVCGEREMAARIKRQLPEWNLSVYAQMAGIAALTDNPKAYLKEAVELLRTERARMRAGLEACGCKVYPSAANFLLCYSEKELYAPLLKKGILIRDCSDYVGLGKGFYRVAVRNHSENEELLTQLHSLMRSGL